MHLPLVQHMHCIQKTNGSLSLGWGSVIAKGGGSGISPQRLKMKPNEPEDNQGVVTDVLLYYELQLQRQLPGPDYRTNWTQQGNCYHQSVVGVSDSNCKEVLGSCRV